MASGDAVANVGKTSSIGGGDFSNKTRMQVHNSEIRPRQWIPDERDNFISWLRGEFAAANAIIDALCHHLRIVGEPGEYDFVLTCIQQRRYNWTVVLHMQQYFSVAEVVYALQQAAWRKQQRNSDHFACAQINPDFRGKDNLSSQMDGYGSAIHGNVNYGSRNYHGSTTYRAESIKKSGQQSSSNQNGSKAGVSVSVGAYEEKTENVGMNTQAQLGDAVSTNSALHSVEGPDNVPGYGTDKLEKQSSSSVNPFSNQKSMGGDESKQISKEQAGSGNNGSNGMDEHEEPKLPNSERNDTFQKGRKSRAAEFNPGKPELLDGASVTYQSGVCDDMLSNVDFRFLSKQEDDRRRTMIMASKNFVGNELLEGKMINTVEGLELYENIFDASELSRLASLIQELKVAGRRGKLRGKTYVVSRRPMKGNGREMIQFGLPIVDGPLEEETTAGTPKDLVEPIPTVLQDVIDRLLRWQIIPEHRKPDCCIINFFNEGDHSQPYISPPHFERSFCTMSLLSECTMVFGRVIATDHPGVYKGSLKIPLPAGSLLVMQGNSADIAKHAICSSAGQRATITFVKVQTKKSVNFPYVSTHISHPSSSSTTHLAPPVGRQSSGNASVPLHSMGRGMGHTTVKHYNAVPTSGVLPVPPVRASQMPQCLSASGIQPPFAGPQGPAGAYPPVAVIPPGWSTTPRPTPRMPNSGTGVFLPCNGSGSGPGQPASLPQQQQGALALSPGSSRSEPSSTATSGESSSTSCPTLSSSKLIAPNQLAFDSLDRDSEKANILSSPKSFPSKIDLTISKNAPGKDIVNRSPKLDSNGSRMIKGDQLHRTFSQSKRTANKVNSITTAGGTVR
eukprot:Gb_29007 [translate_table: standard]